MMYAARTRSGFTPSPRADLMKKFKPLETNECPFANLPEKKAGRSGCWTHSGQDGRLQVAEAGAGGAT